MRAVLIALALLVGLPPACAAASIDDPLILVARPALRDALFEGAVLVVAPLGGDEHVGFIVNRPTPLTLGRLFPERAPPAVAGEPLYRGGPVVSDVMFALVQRKSNPGGGSFEVIPGLYAAYDRKVVARIMDRESAQARFVAGFVIWKAGELRSEIGRGAWYVLEPDARLAMREPRGLWEELVRRSQRGRTAF